MLYNFMVGRMFLHIIYVLYFHAYYYDLQPLVGYWRGTVW